MSDIQDLEVGVHSLRDGWFLRVGDYHGSYFIENFGVIGIWADRTTGGGFGDGSWLIRVIPSIDTQGLGHHIEIHKGFSIEDCLDIVTEMESLYAKYAVKPKEKEKKKKFKWWF